VIKVLSIFGTRPEAIKMAPVVRELAKHPDTFQSVVCVTGQHREMLDSVLRLFEITPDYDLQIMRPSQTLTDVTTAVLQGLDPILKEERPDWVLVQGDTTTAMAGSLAAFYHRIPVGHVEAGLRTADKYQPFPEEINRRITGIIADLHFAPTEWAANNLRREGVPDDRIIVTGNTVIDAIQDVANRPFDPNGTFPPDFPPAGKRLILVTAHRRENFGRGMEEICTALRTLATERDDVHIVYPVHLNPNVQEPVYRHLDGLENVTLLPPLDYQPLVWLMKQSYFVISDSGGIQEEAPGLGKPVLVLRETTERPEGVQAGTVELVGAIHPNILFMANQLLNNEYHFGRMAKAVNPYGTGVAAIQISNALRNIPASITEPESVLGDFKDSGAIAVLQ
jgi:UDP-N-acetylglucosamine 2-epimerase (non-hydrolysing)